MLIINKKTRLNIYSNSNSRIPLKSQNFSSLYNKLQICNSVMYGLRHPITLNKYTNINHLPNFSMLVFNKMFVGIIRLGPIISYRRYLQFSSVQFLLPAKWGRSLCRDQLLRSTGFISHRSKTKNQQCCVYLTRCFPRIGWCAQYVTPRSMVL